MLTFVQDRNKIQGYTGGSGGITYKSGLVYGSQNNGGWVKRTSGEMQDLIEWFVGLKEDGTVIYLMDCPECDVLITYPEQGHHCCGVVDENRGIGVEGY